MISLRPVAGHDGLRRAAARHGAGLIAVSPWRLRTCNEASARTALDAALATSRVIFTSPAAVRAAQSLRALTQSEGQHWLAVGSGTAAALRRAGIDSVRAPGRMDSEGLLALPELQQLDARSVGLVTAPGGLGRIAPALQARGASVLRADVYRREPVVPTKRAIQALRDLHAPAVLALSSGEALLGVLEQLPDDAASILRSCAVAAASTRLAALAEEHGFRHVVLAAGPRPRQLAQAAAQAQARVLG